MTERAETLRSLSDALGQRDLLWGGLRSDDIEPISDLPQVAGAFSIVGGHDRGGAVLGLDFEDLSGVRVDLDKWDIEDHLDAEPAHEFREAILRRLATPTALLPYRSSSFLSSILFARRDRCLDLGLFGVHQTMFDHKPWVETRVAELGLLRVPWTYVADEEQSIARRLLAEGPVVLRVSRSSGGTGVVRVDDPDMLAAMWPVGPEGFASVTAYLDEAVPINIGATVWHDGVTMRHPSVQLIGIPECTTRAFGYCGNDFGLASELDATTLDTMERTVVALGDMLRRYGYLGTFGIDFLVHDGVPLFSEINPRFQGSTHASCQLSAEGGEPCLMLDHIAAVLGHDALPARPLRAIARELPPFAHVVVHWTGAPAKLDVGALEAAFRTEPSHCRTDVVAKPNILTETGGVVARFVTRSQLTKTGFDLKEPWRTFVTSWATDMASGVLGARERSRERQ